VVEPSAEAVTTAPLDAPPAEKRVAAKETPGLESVASAEAQPALDAYTLVIEAISTLLKEPQVDEWLANKMGVRTAQMKDWLDRGVREGRILKLKKPVRYAAHTPTLFAD
jgi:hypothetical protein